MSIGSLDEDWIHSAECLEDSPTLNSHFQLFAQVEWGWLNSCPEAIDMAFIDPTFALCALGKGQWGIDEGLTHRPHPFPFPSYRGGNVGKGHGHLMVLTLSQSRERVGKGQIERDFRERVGKGRLRFDENLGKGSGKGQTLSVIFLKYSGKGGKGSIERD